MAHSSPNTWKKCLVRLKRFTLSRDYVMMDDPEKVTDRCWRFNWLGDGKPLDVGLEVTVNRSCSVLQDYIR
jgi:hypothetical protein